MRLQPQLLSIAVMLQIGTVMARAEALDGTVLLGVSTPILDDFLSKCPPAGYSYRPLSRVVSPDGKAGLMHVYHYYGRDTYAIEGFAERSDESSPKNLQTGFVRWVNGYIEYNKHTNIINIRIGRFPRDVPVEGDPQFIRSEHFQIRSSVQAPGIGTFSEVLSLEGSRLLAKGQVSAWPFTGWFELHPSPEGFVGTQHIAYDNPAVGKVDQEWRFVVTDGWIQSFTLQARRNGKLGLEQEDRLLREPLPYPEFNHQDWIRRWRNERTIIVEKNAASGTQQQYLPKENFFTEHAQRSPAGRRALQIVLLGIGLVSAVLILVWWRLRRTNSARGA